MILFKETVLMLALSYTQPGGSPFSLTYNTNL